MSGSDFSRYTLSVNLVIAMLAGCGGSQPPISASGAMPFSSAHTQSTPARNAGQGKGTVEFAYVADEFSNNISAYAINASNGALTQVQGSPFAAGYGPYGVAIDPTGKFAYVANNGTASGHYSGNVSAFAINPRSGALTPIQGSPFAAGSNPLGVVISPNGKFAYVINYNSANVSIFAIDASTGALKQVKGSPQRTRPFPTAEAIDPAGNFIYATHVGFGNPYDRTGHIAGYAINTRSGALTKLKGTRKVTGSYPVSAAIDPSGKFVYVANYASQNVSAYAITAGTGALSELPGSFHTGFDPGAVAIDPNGSFAYVAFDLGVDAYTIAPNGVLMPVQGSPFAGGYEPDAAAIDPLGKFVYVSNTGPNNDISAYIINPSNGALTQAPGSPFAAGTGPAGIATCEIERDRCVPAIL
jgi:6-phosphogluconolactonase